MKIIYEEEERGKKGDDASIRLTSCGFKYLRQTADSLE